jgi:hypothetical protein
MNHCNAVGPAGPAFPPDAQVHDHNVVGATRRGARPGRQGGKKSSPAVVVIEGLLCNYPAAAT